MDLSSIELQYIPSANTPTFHRTAAAQEAFVVSLGVGASSLASFSPEGPLLLSAEISRWIYLWGRQSGPWPPMGGEGLRSWGYKPVLYGITSRNGDILVLQTTYSKEAWSMVAGSWEKA